VGPRSGVKVIGTHPNLSVFVTWAANPNELCVWHFKTHEVCGAPLSPSLPPRRAAHAQLCTGCACRHRNSRSIRRRLSMCGRC